MNAVPYGQVAKGRAWTVAEWATLGRLAIAIRHLAVLVAGTLVPGTRQDQVPSAVLPGSTKTVPGATRYRPGSSESTTSLV